jgi:hypothetical protein
MRTVFEAFCEHGAGMVRMAWGSAWDTRHSTQYTKRVS